MISSSINQKLKDEVNKNVREEKNIFNERFHFIESNWNQEVEKDGKSFWKDECWNIITCNMKVRFTCEIQKCKKNSWTSVKVPVLFILK